MWNVDDTPHKTNTRHLLNETIEGGVEEWVGFEQEFTLVPQYGEDYSERPIGWV